MSTATFAPEPTVYAAAGFAPQPSRQTPSTRHPAPSGSVPSAPRETPSPQGESPSATREFPNPCAEGATDYVAHCQQLANGDSSPQSPVSSPSAEGATSLGADDDRAHRNRANAQHSTGPRTAEGKARSSQNARKHGLSIQHHCILEGEDPAEFETLRAEIHAAFEPLSHREFLAVEEIAECKWALRRFDQAETTLLNCHFSPYRFNAGDMSATESMAYSCIMEHGEPKPLEVPSIELLLRYRRHWERRHEKALAEFDRATRSRHAETRLQMAREKHDAQMALLQQKFLTERAKYQDRQEQRECAKEPQEQPDEAQSAASSKQPQTASHGSSHCSSAAPSGFVPQNGANGQARAQSGAGQ